MGALWDLDPLWIVLSPICLKASWQLLQTCFPLCSLP
jgi:hypothetical protein